VLEHLAELTELGNDRLAVSAARQVMAEFLGLGGAETAQHPIGGFRVSEIEILRRH
jgi:hypothetical protein